MSEGLLIVLEGVDGVGKSTQCRLLADALGQKNWPVHLTQQPSDGPVGGVLRQILRSRLLVPGPNGMRLPSWQSMAALFAADRLDQLEAEITPLLMDGVTVICDRYDYSSVVFQAALSSDEDDAVQWIRTLNRFVRRPDITFVLEGSSQLVHERLSHRDKPTEIFEDDSLQDNFRRLYSRLEAFFPDDAIVRINNDGSRGAISEELCTHVLQLR